MSWEKVTLVGVGLLGGSLGQALRNRGLARSVVGLVRRSETIEEAKACGAVDEATLDPKAAVTGADLVVLCTPLGTMGAVTKQILPFLGDETIITDVGSAKAAVVREMTQLLADHSALFVGSHPMAGGERSGVQASCSKLFEGAVCAVTPVAETPVQALERVVKLWESVGGKLVQLSPESHDELVSRTSHLTHLAAVALAEYVLKPGNDSEQAQLCGKGFRDTTRVAAGDVTMWRDIAKHNKDAILGALDDYSRELGRIREQIADENWDALADYLASARERRSGLGKLSNSSNS